MLGDKKQKEKNGNQKEKTMEEKTKKNCEKMVGKKPKNLKIMEMRGIDPRTSRMLSERSTIWATSPFMIFLRKAFTNLLDPLVYCVIRGYLNDSFYLKKKKRKVWLVHRRFIVWKSNLVLYLDHQVYRFLLI